ncbi:MAG: hypothetical protein JEZ03_09225 [Bacteroidales bacterium]|nr:hypothetical protein [Bacteroidales bacterium]
MSKILGIRHEDKYVMERRVAVTPWQVQRLISEHDFKIIVEQSPKRVFLDDEFRQAGADVVEDVSDADVIFGVKEMPIDFFKTGKTYVFFSHVIKGQTYNMPSLRKMIDCGVTLIDYEKVTDEMGRRLIFFGRFAGLAGMINSLWAFGQRMKEKGLETPFLQIRQAHTYISLAEARSVISEVGHQIAAEKNPKELRPFVIGFTGYGNVSSGAQEIASLLPLKEISPEELLTLNEREDRPGNMIYKVIFKEHHISKPKDPNAEFELRDYYAHPEKYENQFEKYIPHLSILMNCMYWDDRYPRIITKDFLEELYINGEPRLKVIGDITCDPDGSIECTHKGTVIENPVFVYDPIQRKPIDGFKGNGVLMMAVDILPSELPRDSSLAFSSALEPFIPAIMNADYKKSFEDINIPGPVKRAMILHKGELTPDFLYLKKHLYKTDVKV